MQSAERPEAVRKLFEKFYYSIENQDLVSAKNIIHKIEILIGNDDSELAGCYVKLRLAGMKVKKSDKNQ